MATLQNLNDSYFLEDAMQLSVALEGFILAKSADGLSAKTAESYRWAIAHLIAFLGDNRARA